MFSSIASSTVVTTNEEDKVILKEGGDRGKCVKYNRKEATSNTVNDD